jgi:hypothetical protein
MKNEKTYNDCSENKLCFVVTDNFNAPLFALTFDLKIIIPKNEPHGIIGFSFTKSPKAYVTIILIWVNFTFKLVHWDIENDHSSKYEKYETEDKVDFQVVIAYGI